MMKKLLFLLLVFTQGFAQYSTPGTGVNWGLNDIISNAPLGVMTLTGGVYTLSQNLTISAGDILTINEDTTLKIDADVQITIAGTFTADADAITITATNIETPYETIRFEDGSTGYFNHVSINYGKGIRVSTGNFDMQNCSMSYHVPGTTASAALTFSTGSPVVNNSLFTFNIGPAFGSGANQEVSATFSNNYLENNNTANTNRPQINMGPSGNDTIRIVNNTIKGSPALTMVGGISAASLLGNTNKVIIDNNTITGNRYGITVAGANSSGFIRGNIIEDNNTQDLPNSGGSGISLNAAGASTMNIIASGNQIRRNLWGITLIGTANINLGDGTDESPGGNVFSENGNNSLVYALFNNTPNPVNAINNCWIENATPTEADVENVISHQVDNSALGLVTFSPFTSCLLATPEFTAAKPVVYPNPNSGEFTVGISGYGTMELYSMNGQLLFSQNISAGTNAIAVDLPTGVYMMRTTTDTGSFINKIVRQ